MLTLRQEILLDKLNSDLSIIGARIKARREYVMNQTQGIEARIDDKVANEITKQIKVILKTQLK